METVEIGMGDYETLVTALRQQNRLGDRSRQGDLVTHAANHPEFGPVVLIMNTAKDQGMLIRPNAS